MKGIHVAFEARVTVEPDGIKTTNTGKGYLNLAVAVDVADSATEFVRVTAWEDEAEKLAGNIRKGDSVYVEGKATISRWTDREGAEKSGLQVSAWQVLPLGKIGRRAPKAPGQARTGTWGEPWPPRSETPAVAQTSRARHSGTLLERLDPVG
ncbi:MAG: single-stranded DNA-binding protein [Dehalococcoidia bacterium]